MLKLSANLLLFFLFFQNTALSVKIEIFDETQQDYVGGNAVYKVLIKDYKGPGTEYKIKAEGISHTLQVTKQSFKIQGAGKLESENPVVVVHKSKLKKILSKILRKDTRPQIQPAQTVKLATKRNINRDGLHILRATDPDITQTKVDFLKNSTPPQVTVSAYAEPEVVHAFFTVTVK